MTRTSVLSVSLLGRLVAPDETTRAIACLAGPLIAPTACTLLGVDGGIARRQGRWRVITVADGVDRRSPVPDGVPPRHSGASPSERDQVQHVTRKCVRLVDHHEQLLLGGGSMSLVDARSGGTSVHRARAVAESGNSRGGSAGLSNEGG